MKDRSSSPFLYASPALHTSEKNRAYHEPNKFEERTSRDTRGGDFVFLSQNVEIHGANVIFACSGCGDVIRSIMEKEGSD